MFNFFVLFFEDSAGTHIGWAVGLVLVFIMGLYLGWSAAVKRYKKDPRENWIKASQVRELYRQLGRTPTERQIKQLLAAVNKQN
ncbi:YneF family protein [Mycoplasma suis]|uniref:Uncharacterized protein domain family (UPF0154) n=1 Tax=Mycoplasma suis (strain Illinois) TaxID=768700 RepID=F0QRD5_MYCSL|nr:YneF family protein [Mycoplasma suis]ADX98055.1 uncharacterized protein domain family (UPF0154) [Mycoplasma suis str. Illinois]